MVVKNPEHVASTINDVVMLESQDVALGHRLADAVTAFSGSLLFVGVNAVFFAAWLVLNVTHNAFDPYPFGLLTVIVSLEAIFLALMVLMSQSRQALRADRRAKVDLQVNMIAERELTRLLTMVHQIQHALGIADASDELEEMKRPTSVDRLAE